MEGASLIAWIFLKVASCGRKCLSSGFWIYGNVKVTSHYSLLTAQINLSQKVLAIRKRETYLIKAPGTYGGGSMPPSWQCPIKALGQK